MSYLRLRQVCLVAPELDTPVRDLLEIFDLRVCHRDPHLARYGLENVIFAVGTDFIEIVAPITAGTTAGRFLERSGGHGGYMAIFDCDDPLERARHAADLGVLEVNRQRVESYLGVQLHPRDCRAAMIEFNHTDGGDQRDGAYWPAGADWRATPASSVARALLSVDLETAVPEDLAWHWSRILGVAPTQHDTFYQLDGDGIDLRFLHADHPRECIGALRLQVDDPSAVLENARRLGYPVHGDAFHLAGVNWRPTAI